MWNTSSDLAFKVRENVKTEDTTKASLSVASDATCSAWNSNEIKDELFPAGSNTHDKDEITVVNHVNTHEFIENDENSGLSFFRNGYAVTACSNNVSVAQNDATQDEENEEHNGIPWTDQPTKLLISLYKEKKPLVEFGKIKTPKRMWQQIADKMNEFGYKFTQQKIENKWKSLERSFKSALENRNKTGRGRKVCPYERELNEILGKRHSIQPLCVLGSIIENTEENNIGLINDDNIDTFAQSDSAVDSNSSVSETPTRKRLRSIQNDEIVSESPTRKRLRKTQKSEIEKLREAIEKRTAEKKIIEERKLELKEKMISELQHRNELLEKILDKLSNEKIP